MIYWILKYFVLVPLLLIYALYIYFCALTNLQRVYQANKLTLLGKCFAYPSVVIGVGIDVIVNTFIATVVFMEFPKEWTLSMRLKRYLETGSGYRLAVAKWIEPVLDPLDPSGDHI